MLSTNCKNYNFDLSYKVFNTAADGFVYNLEFDLEDCFTCVNCGISPRWFVGDGKQARVYIIGAEL